MAKRSEFISTEVAPKIVKSFEIYGNYSSEKPYRGITEIEELIDLCERNNSFISGGYARYCMSPAHNPIKPNDLDIFSSDMQNHEAIVQAFRENFSTCIRFKEEILHRKEREDVSDYQTEVNDAFYPDEEETEFAISFRPNLNAHPGLGSISKIQFIKPSANRTVSGPLMDILDNFDFTICKVAILSRNVGIFHAGMPEDEISRMLRILGPIKNPIATFARVVKYVKKGYNLSPLTLIQILEAWKNSNSDLQLANLVDLAENQLNLHEHSSELDKEIDFHEARKLQDQVENLQKTVEQEKIERGELPKKAVKIDFSKWAVVPSLEYANQIKDVYSNSHVPAKRIIHLDKEGQLLLQSRDTIGDFGD